MLPTVRVKCFGVYVSHCLVMLKAAVSSEVFMNTGVRWIGLHQLIVIMTNTQQSKRFSFRTVSVKFGDKGAHCRVGPWGNCGFSA